MRTNMKLGALIVVISLVAYPACDSDDPVSSNGGKTPIVDETPPVIDIRLEVEQLLPYCPYWLELTFDASHSTDNVTRSSDLKVRWDRESDGVWDSGWIDVDLPAYRHTPEMEELILVGSTRRVRCEVRDAAGNVAEHTESFSMGDLPTSPDLMPTRVKVRVGNDVDTNVDTVHVAEAFDLGHTFLCWGVPGGTSHDVRYLIDGIEVARFTMNNNASLCVGTGGRGSSSFLEPGEHTITVILDPDDSYPESNEANNAISETIVVIP